MEFQPGKCRIVEKMFDAALKEKMNQLARTYDPRLVFKLWRSMTKNEGVKPYFCKWRWNANMTISEAIECFEDYFIGLETQLKAHQAMRDSKRIKNDKYKGPANLNTSMEKLAY